MEEGLAKVYIDNGENSLLLRLVPAGSFVGLSAVSDEFTTFPYSAKVYVDSGMSAETVVRLLRKFSEDTSSGCMEKA